MKQWYVAVCLTTFLLTHWAWVTHICTSKLIIIGSDNGLSPGQRQAIIWTYAGILLIWTVGTNFNEIWTGTQTFSFKKIHLKMLSAKWRPFCLSLNVLTYTLIVVPVWHSYTPAIVQHCVCRCPGALQYHIMNRYHVGSCQDFPGVSCKLLLMVESQDNEKLSSFHDMPPAWVNNIAGDSQRICDVNLFFF